MDKETKLQRLQEVLNEYEPFLRNYNKIDVELGTTANRLFYEQIGKNKEGLPIFKIASEIIPPIEVFKISYYGTKNDKAYQAYNVEIPIEDLDITIKRYKEKVNYWKNKEVKI